MGEVTTRGALRPLDDADRESAGPAPVVAFSPASAHAYAARALRMEAAAFAERHGNNAYSDFILKRGRRPDPKEAATIGRLIGMRVKASDGSMQPRSTRAERDGRKQARIIQKEEARIDEELSRACDAIAFLAQNESDPLVLMRRISLPEAESLTIQLEKSVEWLNRFANQWRRHVQNGPIQTEEPAPGDGNRTGAKGLYLVRSRD